jgi:hypothetical protein
VSPPSLTEVVDRRAGLIRATGTLTSLGADLLRGTADGLRGSGHVRVVLDLRGVRSAEPDGLDILRQMRRDFAADGGELLIRA